MSATKSLLEIIKRDLAARGHKGPVTRAAVKAWRARNPLYGDSPLWGLFHSGSEMQMMGNTPMDRIMTAWCAGGHPGPGKPGFTWAEFQVFADGYSDEYLELEDERKGKMMALAVEDGEIVSIMR